MRATMLVLIGALALAQGTAAADASAMSNMPGMPKAAASAGKHGQGTGVIKAIDAKAGTLTIQHGPIPAVSWPAMTMTFKAAKPQLLNGLKVGQAIGFDTTVTGMAAEVTAVRPK